MSDRPANIWGELDAIGEGVSGARLLERPRGTKLVSAVWELAPGASSGPYHAHHATEELLVVLAGTPTLRTPDGERELALGDVAHFPLGAAGAHQVINRSDAPARYLVTAAHSGLDVIEYIDERRVVAYSHRPSALSEETLFLSHDLGSAEPN